jgi:hypothetical protein
MNFRLYRKLFFLKLNEAKEAQQSKETMDFLLSLLKLTSDEFFQNI